MKILLIGSGGREHALAWKLQQSPLCEQLICAPGNGGIGEIADLADIDITDNQAIIDFAKSEAIDFVVIGPEIPLANGIIDALSALGIACFGPTMDAAMLESSKAFTKDFCTRHDIPTAGYDVFTNIGDAQKYIQETPPPYVIKADGLAAGKGVVIAQDKESAAQELEEFFSGKFGDAGTCVVIEEFLTGPEISFFAVADGKTALALGHAQDHKRAFDGDTGPNTGGMGAYSPVPGFDQDSMIMEQIIKPTVRGMAQEGAPFSGILFAGLMMTETGPKLIEYNVRFGDPECQVLMQRLDCDLLQLMVDACHGRLAQSPPIVWNDICVVNIVLAANGYPGAYEKGGEIKGVETANLREGVQVFHAGTQRSDDGKLRAIGGRVLNITARGKTLEQALNKAYSALVDDINWSGGFYRRDIAHLAMNNKKNNGDDNNEKDNENI